jgi:hypothetical protein
MGIVFFIQGWFYFGFNGLKIKSLRLKSKFIFSPTPLKPADDRNGEIRAF